MKTFKLLIFFFLLAISINAQTKKGQKTSSQSIAPQSQSVVNEEDIVTIQSLLNENVWQIVKAVLREKQFGIAQFSEKEDRLITVFLEWQTLNVSNKGQIEFLFNPPILTIRMINHQYNSSNGWTPAIGSLSKKNREFYLQAIADRIMEISKEVPQESPPVPIQKPTYDSSFFNTASKYLKEQDYNNAIIFFTKAIEYDKLSPVSNCRKIRKFKGEPCGNPISFVRRGFCYTQKMRGWIDLVLKKYSTMTGVVDPIVDSASFYMNRADKDYSDALEIDPNNRNAYFHRGLSYFQWYSNYSKDQYDAVKYSVPREYFLHAIEINPQDAISYYYLGLCEEGEDEEPFRKCILYSKDSTMISGCYEEIGKGKMKKNQFNDAAKEFSNSISYNKTSWNAYEQRGLSKLSLKDFDGAIEDFSWLIRNYPKYSRPYFLRGKATMAKTGTYKAGCPDFNKALELGDKSEEVKQYNILCK